ncbi:MAG: DUF4236 domain-containing protein [Actinomycetia bacterium]|nr:DUF4236 domain-containing protein [Actinomycetes bacterium]
MAIRFRRTMKIAPGVRLNLTKKGASVRVGGMGFGVTMGTSGTRVSAGIPGTGLSATRKLSGSTSPRSSSARTTGTAAQSQMSVKDAARAIGPQETGFNYPGWWLTGAIVFVLAALGGAYFALVLAVACGYMVWRRLNSAKYRGLKSIGAASAAPSPESDDAVRQVAAQLEDSWTIQREAGLYFLAREMSDWAVGYLGKAVTMFPGDKRPLLAVTADAAVDAGQPDYAIGLLEPHLASAAPDDSDLDAALVSMLALALHKKGDSARALEVVGRLPLRRRNLSQPLLLGLCIRAMAKHSCGKKADAKRDLDRVYAADPSFPFLAEAQTALSDA